MFTVDAGKIRELMVEHGIASVGDLARKAKIHELTAGRVVKDGATAQFKVLAALANLFGVNCNDLILKGGD